MYNVHSSEPIHSKIALQMKFDVIDEEEVEIGKEKLVRLTTNLISLSFTRNKVHRALDEAGMRCSTLQDLF